MLCFKFYFAEMFCILQPHCSGFQNYKFGGSARTGRVGLRSAVKRRKSAFLKQSHTSPCLHRSNICRQAVSAWQLASPSLAVDTHQHVSGLCTVLVSVTTFQSLQSLAVTASLAAMQCFKTPHFFAQLSSTSHDQVQVTMQVSSLRQQW